MSGEKARIWRAFPVFVAAQRLNWRRIERQIGHFSLEADLSHQTIGVNFAMDHLVLVCVLGMSLPLLDQTRAAGQNVSGEKTIFRVFPPVRIYPEIPK